MVVLGERAGEGVARAGDETAGCPGRRRRFWEALRQVRHLQVGQ